MFGSLFAGFSLIAEYRSRRDGADAGHPGVPHGAAGSAGRLRDVVVLVVQAILLTLVAIFVRAARAARSASLSRWCSSRCSPRPRRGVVRHGAAGEERGRARAAAQRDRDAVAAALGHPAADDARPPAWPGPGAKVIGSRIPESSSTGWATVLISGASASSLLTFSATAYETAEVQRRAAGRSSRPTPMPTPRRRSNDERGSDDHDRLDEQRDDVAHRPAEQQGEPADRGDPDRSMTPARSSAISPEARRTARRRWRAARAGRARRSCRRRRLDAWRGSVERLQQRREEHRYMTGWTMPDEHPDRVAQQQPHRALEDQARCREERFLMGVSPASASAQRAAGLGEEDVVEAGPAQLDRRQREPGRVERAQDRREAVAPSSTDSAHVSSSGPRLRTHRRRRRSPRPRAGSRDADA